MPLKECPHCQTNTIIQLDAEKWPCCNELTANDSKINVEDTKAQIEQENKDIMLSHTFKMAIGQLLSGLFIIIFTIGIYLYTSSTVTLVYTGGIIMGIGLIINGIVNFASYLKMKNTRLKIKT